MGSVLDSRLIVVTGKGGVGKSSITAALALRSVRMGRRTLFCELNSQERIAPLLEVSGVGSTITAIEENLWGVNITPEQAMREYALMLLKFESIYNAVFENRLVRYFLRFIPSLQELVMLGKIIYHVDERLPDSGFKYQTVVVDGPATGHAISLLALPRVLLNTVPPGPMARAARQMRDTLEDVERTAVALVSLPEEMSVNETLELARMLNDRAGIQPRIAILNGVVSARFSESDLEALRFSPALLSLALDHREQVRRCDEFRARLELGLKLPVISVPRSFEPKFGRRAIEELSQRLMSPLPLGEGQGEGR